jgi:hypothetical protein
MSAHMPTQLTARLLHDIREEVIGLLFNRYVFRTHQEIVRLNPRLQGRPRSIFSERAQINYAVTNAVGLRRIASETYQDSDVNLVRLLDMLIRHPGGLWDCFLRHFPNDAARVRAEILRKEGQLPSGWGILACKRLVGEDRSVVIRAAEKDNRFANKRAAHSVPDVPVSTTFSDLDDAIEAVKKVTEKYTLLVCAERRQELGLLHRAGAPTVYPLLVQMEKNLDLLEEMKRRKLPKGWDSIFLEPWAKPEAISQPLGETPPPRRVASGD